MPPRPIPQKLYYRIGEVAEIVGVKPHVLRYWETEFSFLSPQKTEGNHRLYTHRDLQKVLTIKKLLYEDRYTISGAKKRFWEEWRKVQARRSRAGGRKALLAQLRAEVEDLIRLLEDH